MFSSTRSTLRLLAGALMAACASATDWVVRTPIAVAVATVVRFVVELPAFLFDVAASYVKRGLALFGATGVFAVALERLAGLVKTMFRNGGGSGCDKHYRAPGSWVSCAST